MLRQTFRSQRRPWEAAALLAFACGCTHHGGEGDAARPLEMMVANDPETLDPRYATDAVGLRATRLVHAGLVRLDPDTLAPEPYLAQELALRRSDDPARRAAGRCPFPLRSAAPGV